MVKIAPGTGGNRGQVLSIAKEADPIKQWDGTSVNPRRFLKDCAAYWSEAAAMPTSLSLNNAAETPKAEPLKVPSPFYMCA